MRTDTSDALVDTMRGLRADRRGVTTRELCGRSGWSETEVRQALARATARGQVTPLGRSPRGAQLYTLVDRRGAYAPSAEPAAR
jgi:DNA-binding transcriptional regulator PaaX